MERLDVVLDPIAPHAPVTVQVAQRREWWAPDGTCPIRHASGGALPPCPNRMFVPDAMPTFRFVEGVY